MIAVGMGSIFCSFFGCLPLTASFSRSSVMSASGAKTQFANFFNGIFRLIFFFSNLKSQHLSSFLKAL
jgi:MFS superfamily sulfate permease-like transporter